MTEYPEWLDRTEFKYLLENGLIRDQLIDWVYDIQSARANAIANKSTKYEMNAIIYNAYLNIVINLYYISACRSEEDGLSRKRYLDTLKNLVSTILDKNVFGDFIGKKFNLQKKQHEAIKGQFGQIDFDFDICLETFYSKKGLRSAMVCYHQRQKENAQLNFPTGGKANPTGKYAKLTQAITVSIDGIKYFFASIHDFSYTVKFYKNFSDVINMVIDLGTAVGLLKNTIFNQMDKGKDIIDHLFSRENIYFRQFFFDGVNSSIYIYNGTDQQNYLEMFIEFISHDSLNKTIYKEYFAENFILYKKYYNLDSYNSREIELAGLIQLIFLIIASVQKGQYEPLQYFYTIDKNKLCRGVLATLDSVTQHFRIMENRDSLELYCKIIKIIGTEIFKRYKNLSSLQKLEVGLDPESGINFFLELVSRDYKFIIGNLTNKNQLKNLNYQPLSHYYINLIKEKKEIYDFIAKNLDFFHVNFGKLENGLAFLSSWVHDDNNRLSSTDAKDYSIEWKSFFDSSAPSGVFSTNLAVLELEWYEIARDIRRFRRDKKAGLVPNIPEVKEYFNAQNPPAGLPRLDLKKKNAYMKQLGFEPLALPYTDFDFKKGITTRKASYFIEFQIVSHLKQYGPLHVQAGDNHFIVLLGITQGLANIEISLIDRGTAKQLPLHKFVEDYLYYPDFIKEEYYHSVQIARRGDSMTSTYGLIRHAKNNIRKGHMPFATQSPKGMTSSDFYSPIYYFKG